MNKAANAYIQAVKKLIRCDAAEKSQLTAGFVQNIERFIEENETADMTVLCQNFGPPAAIWIAITVYIFCVKSQPLIAYEYVTGHHIGSVE